MNQFKKARQRALETGHQVENIADLKTAGIKQENNEEKKEVEKKTTKEVAISKTDIQTNSQTSETNNIPINNEPIDRTSIQNTVIEEPKKQEVAPSNEVLTSESPSNTSDLINEAEVLNKNSNFVPQETISIQSAEQNDVSLVSPANIISEEIATSELHQMQPPTLQIQPEIQEYNHVNIPDSITVTSNNINQELESINIDSEPETSITELEPTQSIATTNAIPIPQKVSQPVVMNQQAQTAQTNYQPEQFRAASQPVRNSSQKKNIPNIFAPKGEAKSMRKSLVLKPTSVKIAENYCAKNGGSFNELVQTLLDNFIDEYGL